MKTISELQWENKVYNEKLLITIELIYDVRELLFEQKTKIQKSIFSFLKKKEIQTLDKKIDKIDHHLFRLNYIIDVNKNKQEPYLQYT